MISEVLHDAVMDMDRYLGDALFKDLYSGQIRADLVDLRNRMDEMRVRLDAMPPARGDLKP